MVKKRSINIFTTDTHIIIEHIRSKTQWIVSKTPQIQSVLSSRSSHFIFESNKRLRTLLSYNGNQRGKKKPYFAPLMYGCYRCGVTAKNIHSTMPRLMEKWSNPRIHIDHLDENKYNNTKYNLSLLPQSIHIQKTGLPLKFKAVFNLILAYDDEGRYRVQFTYTAKGKAGDGHTIRYYCDTPAEMLNILKFLCDNKYIIRNSNVGTSIDSDVYEIVTIKRFGIFTPIHLIKSLYETHEIQEYIAHMPISSFAKWTGKANNVEQY